MRALADGQKQVETFKIDDDGHWYSSNATEGLFNSDMVLYLLRELNEYGPFPESLLDRNVRTAYEHITHFGASGSEAKEERQTIFAMILSQRSIQLEIRNRVIRDLQWERKHGRMREHRAASSIVSPANHSAFGDQRPAKAG